MRYASGHRGGVSKRTAVNLTECVKCKAYVYTLKIYRTTHLGELTTTTRRTSALIAFHDVVSAVRAGAVYETK